MFSRSFIVPEGMATFSTLLFLWYSLLITASIPSWCGIFRYSDFTSIVVSMQFSGIIVFSSRFIMSPLSFMWDFMAGTKGCNCKSMNWDIFSVGPPHPLTIGLTAIGFLCIFFKKYSCCVLGVF